MRCNMSVLGAYVYNSHLFDEMVLPAELIIDKPMLVENLVAELAELEILYTDLDVFEHMIAKWSQKQLPVWDELCKTLHYEYNPIHNYDRNETWNESRGSGNRSNTHSTTNGDAASVGSGNATTTERVAGMNDPAAAGTMADRSATEGYNRNGVESHDETESSSETVQESAHENEHTSHVYGNIGVTTTQEMIKAQRELVRFNMFDVIIDDFRKRFCLLIY